METYLILLEQEANGESVVNELDWLALGEKDIGGLEVAVDNLLLAELL